MNNQSPTKPKIIVFTGPESSGKTTICKLAAKHFQTDWVEEYSRIYLSQLNHSYVQADLVEIAKGQFKVEQETLLKATKNRFIFLDTSFLLLKIWSMFKYGSYNFEIEKLLRQNLPDYYFLCDWDIPWEYDPMRENQNDRKELYDLYKSELLGLGVPFYEIKGTLEERLENIIDILDIIN